MVVAAEEFVRRARRRTPARIALLSPATRKARRSTAPARGASCCRRAARRLDCLHRRRADLGRAARRHDQERPPRHAVGHGSRSRACRATSPTRSWRATRSIALAPALAELVATRWDDGNAYFPADHAGRCRNIHAGTGALNVIPGELVVDFNFRFSTESTPDVAEARACTPCSTRHGVDYDIAWTLGGEPFLTTPGTLSEALVAAIDAECGATPELSTTGGTSDGRFIATHLPAGDRVRARSTRASTRSTNTSRWPTSSR